MDKQTISIQLNLEVPADDYDYGVDDEGRIEYWADLVLREEMVGVTAVSTGGPSGSGFLPNNGKRDVVTIAYRDPDADTEIRTFVNGVYQADESGADYDFDPGRGQESHQVRSQAYAVLSKPDLSEELADALRQGYAMTLDSNYTDSQWDEQCALCGANVSPDEEGSTVLIDDTFGITCPDGQQHAIEQEFTEDTED